MMQRLLRREIWTYLTRTRMLRWRLQHCCNILAADKCTQTDKFKQMVSLTANLIQSRPASTIFKIYQSTQLLCSSSPWTCSMTTLLDTMFFPLRILMTWSMSVFNLPCIILLIWWVPNQSFKWCRINWTCLSQEWESSDLDNKLWDHH